MADAVCGPSNALQNFQKHSSVDRTLQQDRLVGRHSPSQGFRSSPGLNAGALDQEFEAFQAGRAGPPQLAFQQLPLHLARPPPPQFAPAPPQAPDWASDFQRLNISASHTPQAQQQRVPAPNAASAWHQDFMSQQGPAVQTPRFQQNTFGGMSGYARPAYQHSGFGMMNGTTMSEVAQGKQPAQEPVPQFDEAAFERAFADAQQDMLEETAVEQTKTQADVVSSREQLGSWTELLENGDLALVDRILGPPSPDILEWKEKKPGTYAVLRLRSAVQHGVSDVAQPYLSALMRLEASNSLMDQPQDAKFIVDVLQQIVVQDASQQTKEKCEHLIRLINERLMSTYPLLAQPINSYREDMLHERAAAEPLHQQPEQKQEEQQQQQQQEQPPLHNDDEMAETAGKLLERVSDNTSEKFKNSQFLSLMRRLRDREVRVEGDNMVEVSSAPSTSSLQPSSSDPSQLPQSQQPHTQPPTTATTIPPVDPHILSHAATDFTLPIYSADDDDLPRTTNESI